MDVVILNILDFTAEDLEKLPLGYQLPIKEILHHHKHMDQTSMSLETAIFLGKYSYCCLFLPPGVLRSRL